MNAATPGWVSLMCRFPAFVAGGAIGAIALVLGALLFAGAYWLEDRRHAV
jgi:hypothetical protein